MTLHLLKLVWRRKRSTGLIMAEIFLSFLVLFVVATVGLYFFGNYRRPLGFDWRGVWLVQVSPNVDFSVEDTSRAYARSMERMVREIRGIDGVAAASAVNLAPYDDSNWSSTEDLEDGRDVSYDVNHAMAGLKDVLDLRVVRGRWFEEADTALGWEPIVVDASMARTLFGDEDPIGRRYPSKDSKDSKEPERRVVGVVSDFRKAGELEPDRNYMFRFLTEETESRVQLRNILLRLDADTPATFEEGLVRRLEALEPGWTFETKTLEEMRETRLRQQLVPLAIGGTIAGFLMLMVALGLTGVLWQNVTQRRQEIGLRRAVGAAARRIHRQILMELMWMTSLAVLVGLILVLQIPALPIPEGTVRIGLVTSGAALAAVLIFLLAGVSGFYPSWLATRTHPVEALHYE